MTTAQLHADDAALLDRAQWSQPTDQPHCSRCTHDGPTVHLGHDLRYCRGCVGDFLVLARERAESRGRRGYMPALPEFG